MTRLHLAGSVNASLERALLTFDSVERGRGHGLSAAAPGSAPLVLAVGGRPSSSVEPNGADPGRAAAVARGPTRMDFPPVPPTGHVAAVAALDHQALHAHRGRHVEPLAGLIDVGGMDGG
jgi:hypothetical protein